MQKAWQHKYHRLLVEKKDINTDQWKVSAAISKEHGLIYYKVYKDALDCDAYLQILKQILMKTGTNVCLV